MWVGGDWTLLGGPLSIITVKKKNLSSTFNHFLHSTLANTYVHTHVQRYVHTHTHTHIYTLVDQMITLHRKVKFHHTTNTLVHTLLVNNIIKTF